MKLRPLFAILSLLFLLAGCAAVGVVASDDPAVKLQQAESLMAQNPPRMIPAERIMKEAEEIYLARGDKSGLAETYRVFALYHEIAQEHAKAKSYYEKQYALASESGNIVALLNAELNLARNHYFMGRKQAACDGFDKFLASYKKQKREKPSLEFHLPAGATSWDSVVSNAKNKIGC